MTLQLCHQFVTRIEAEKWNFRVLVKERRRLIQVEGLNRDSQIFWGATSGTPLPP